MTVRIGMTYSNSTVATIHIGNSVHWYSDRIGMAYSNSTVATVHIGNSVHWYSDSEDWNGIQ